MSRKINQAGIDIIKRFESLHDGDLSTIGLQPKMCPAGIWTVGYGRALTNHNGAFLRGEQGKKAAYNLYGNLTVEDAEEMLREDLDLFSEGVSRLLKVDVTDNQFSALVSLAYNIGLGNLRNSTVIKRLNAGDTQGAAEAILWWNKASGKVLRGLQARREAEKLLFLTTT